MQVCVRHGKKRQIMYLQRSGEKDEWVCRPSSQCKLCHSEMTKSFRDMRRPNHFNAEWMPPAPFRRHDRFENEPVPMNTDVGQPTIQAVTPTQKPEAHTPTILVSLSETEFKDPSDNTSTSITSWADEVDKEFPYPQNESIEMPTESCEERRKSETSSVASIDSPGYNRIPKCSPREYSYKPRYSSARKEYYGRPADLIERVEVLEEELSSARKDLKQSRDHMIRMMKNERTLENKVRELCLEIVQMRQQQLQFEFTWRKMNEERRASSDRNAVGYMGSNLSPLSSGKHVILAGPKLNPEAVPFLPSSAHDASWSPIAESARSGPITNETQADGSRSAQQIASSRSSNFSYATNSNASFDSENLEFTPRQM